MEQRLRVAITARALAIAAATLLAGAIGGSAVAQQSPDMIVAEEPWPNGGGYFIDFRSRRSTYIGHTYIVYGRLNAERRVVEMHYAGLIPEVDAWKGLIAPVRATVRRYIDDTQLTPTAIYRRRLTAAEYRQVKRTVEYLHATEHQWHAIFQNCNDFGIQIAEALGLWRPPSLMPPSAWVAGLRALNER
jgi:hypothetical protein